MELQITPLVFPPHRRGWTAPSPDKRHRSASVFPPHRRGWTRRAGCDALRISGAVSPAQAGMDLAKPRMELTVIGGFPRTGGDGPSVTEIWLQLAWWVSPAQAGMDPTGRTCPGADREARRFPRTGGDGPDAWYRSISGYGQFPPHRRGWTPYQARRHWTQRPSRFPRTGGDGPIEGLCYQRIDGKVFPPHRRGWTPWRRVR